MRLLPDTHILLWAVLNSNSLSAAAASLIGDPGNEVFYSAVSIWEVAIKTGRGRQDFQVDPARLRHVLNRNGYTEISVSSLHAVNVITLPPIHKDPFDRMMIAQATTEQITLLTTDEIVAKYPGPIRKV